MHRRLFVILAVFFISACTSVVEWGEPIRVFFCPPDDCNGVIVGLVKNSSEVVCAWYSMGVSEVVGVLREKSARIVTEDAVRKRFEGLEVRTDGRQSLMHNKFCVLDNKIVVTGSYNPVERPFLANNMLVIPSRFVAENYLAEFEELWGKKSKKTPFPVVIYNNATIRTAFCPEDGCADSVLDVLNDAKNSIVFMTASFTDDRLGEVIDSFSGVVKGLFDKRQLSKFSEYDRLKDVSKTGNIHHKVFIVDGETVVTGSYNPTQNGNTKNDENVLIIRDKNLAKEYLQEFERLWNVKNK